MTQKEIAINCLELLGIYKPYINKFKSKAGIPCFFENFSGFYVDQEPEIYNKIKDVEEEYGVLVYAITHNICELGDLWSMLCVPKDCDGIEDVLSQSSTSNHFYTYSYVWNKSNEIFSEFGDVLVRSHGGGIRRVG